MPDIDHFDGDAVLLTYLLLVELSLEAVESQVSGIVQWVRFGAELISILIITIGIIVTAYAGIMIFISRSKKTFDQIRFTFSRYLVIALEFELAADIIGTAISPTWDQLGKLAVIAVIRTFLNYFLGKEMKEEKKALAENPVAARPGGEA